MSWFRFGFPNQRARAVEDNDIERNGARAKNARCGRPRRLCDEIAQRLGDFCVSFPGEVQDMLRRVRYASFRAKFSPRPGALKQAREPFIIDAPAFGVEVEQPLSKFGHLGEPAADRDAGDRMLLQVFDHAANEIAHLYQGFVRQSMHAPDGGLRGGAGCACDVLESAGACDIDPAVDGMNPGGAGKWHDDAGRSEHGKAAKDAKARIERLFRQRLAAGMEISTTMSSSFAP